MAGADVVAGTDGDDVGGGSPIVVSPPTIGAPEPPQAPRTAPTATTSAKRVDRPVRDRERPRVALAAGNPGARSSMGTGATAPSSIDMFLASPLISSGVPWHPNRRVRR